MDWKKLFINESKTETTDVKPIAKTQKMEVKSSAAPTPLSSGSSPAFSSTPKVGFTPTPVPATTVSSADKEQFLSYLKSKYAEANFPGPDYQEFIAAIEQMANLPMDNKTKFMTAFITLQSLGVTKQKLIDSGNKYIEFFGHQVDGFNAEIDNVFKTEIAQSRVQADKLKAEIEEIDKQMQLLNEKKLKNAENFNKINSEINDQTTTLNNQRTTFGIVAKEFAESISNNLKDIETYLP